MTRTKVFLLSEIAPGVPNLGNSKGDKRAAPGEEDRLVFTKLPLGFGNISSGLVRNFLRVILERRQSSAHLNNDQKAHLVLPGPSCPPHLSPP